jgi:hypothetical protein
MRPPIKVSTTERLEVKCPRKRAEEVEGISPNPEVVFTEGKHYC